MSNVDVIGLFKQAALEVHGRELGALDAATEISTLGLDSVAVMEMTGCLEEKLKIRIPDEELAEVETLGELDTLIRRVIAVPVQDLAQQPRALVLADDLEQRGE